MFGLLLEYLTNFLALHICTTGLPLSVDALTVWNVWKKITFANEVAVCVSTVHGKVSTRELIPKFILDPVLLNDLPRVLQNARALVSFSL